MACCNTHEIIVDTKFQILNTSSHLNVTKWKSFATARPKFTFLVSCGLKRIGEIFSHASCATLDLRCDVRSSTAGNMFRQRRY
jgi:hypothetical protein